jgi:hypothetical protein
VYMIKNQFFALSQKSHWGGGAINNMQAWALGAYMAATRLNIGASPHYSTTRKKGWGCPHGFSQLRLSLRDAPME